MGALYTSIWQCPECGRSVNGFVNSDRCPSCRTTVLDPSDSRRDTAER